MLVFENNGCRDSGLIARVAAENGISELLSAALCLRGLTTREAVQAYLRPSLEALRDPMELLDMDKAVMRIRAAVENRESILVYGDYDVDGVCATAILYQYLSSLGATVSVHIPLRHGEGYGMNKSAVELAAKDGIDLIITVDNGIAAQEEIALAQSLHMDVVVTDHHQCPDALPGCAAVVNPHRPDGRYPYGELCGAGVALKLVEALGGRGEMQKYLCLAALATVADVVPLTGENRVIVALGMEKIHRHPGLMALLEAAGAANERVTSDTLAFRLAPRINAAGRMGDATRAFQLLCATSREQAMPLALMLDEENAKRQMEERQIVKSAREKLADYDFMENRGIVLFDEGWNPGIVGIVASRLVEEYHRPVLLLYKEGDSLTGSGRSIPGVHLFDCLKACETHLTRYGGHSQAAGLTLQQDAFPAFFEAFQTYLRESVPAERYLPRMGFEVETKLFALTMPVVEELQWMAPFGEGNPQPVFCTRNVQMEQIERMGKERTHLRAMAAQEERRVALVAFHMGHQAERWAPHGLAVPTFDILYTAEINAFRGNKRLQLMLKAANETSFWQDGPWLNQQITKFYNAFFQNVLYNVSRDAICVKHCGDIDAAVVASLTHGIEGTLILCATLQGAQRLKSLLLQEKLAQRAEAGFSFEASATSNNTIVLAPCLDVLQTQWPRYQTIIAYDFTHDGPIALSLLGGCTCPVLAGTDRGSEQGFFAPLKTDRAYMEGAYRALSLALKEGSLSRDQLILRALPGETYESALLTLLIFAELGFFKYNQATGEICRVPNPTARTLEESMVFAAS